MKTPPFLTKGDKVAIVTPAKQINASAIERAIKIFSGWGLKVVVGSNALSKSNYFAGDDEDRVADFQQMLDDNTVKAIFCARGGYGTIRLIDKLDFTKFVNNPKWIVGYSDITVLHSHIQQNFEIDTLHAIMPLDYPEDEEDSVALNMLKEVLFNEKDLKYAFPTVEQSRKGFEHGILTGGNLSVLLSVMGSSSEVNLDGKILFIEEVGEQLYHFDRMIQTLKRAQKLVNLKGIIVGQMSNMEDNKGELSFGKSIEEIVLEAVEEYDFPVCFNFPAGHVKENLPMIFGRHISLSVREDISSIEFFSSNNKEIRKTTYKNIAISGLTIVAMFVIIYLLYSVAIHLIR